MIIAGGCLELLVSHNYTVVLKDNKPQRELQEYCAKSGIHYLVDQPMGFGANNNCVFNWCQKELGMRDEDRFLVLNPDVIIEPSVLAALLLHAELHAYPLVAINLFNDRDFTLYDNGIRRFPTISNFAISFLLQKNNTNYDKSKITQDTEVEWAAGSFLLFTAKYYRELGGFDTRYYMYCEDLDICWRARRKLKVNVVYLPQFKALHLAQMRSRSLFSKHFIWHATSALRFCLKQALNK
ncbi:glycosyl transferase family protein [Providencia burhodogranariea DSM 19968]|uniref:Glycosyl transferase family protein n=2 Tax=Providencia burhodogranariea TaxID=516074 RepID=K8WF16_9GAMM|nr:glycosyl transferase family protein [Providencia burhodogranariea DSM 19968]